MPFTSETLARHGKGSLFIETGTYLGDGVQAALDAGFKTIHSIELNKTLYDKAVERFRDIPGVTIWLGDSADVLPEILDLCPKDQTCTVWLDAHASGPLPGGRSGGTPVVDEVRALFRSGVRCVILIDDARLFGSREWSGITIDRVLSIIPKDYTVSREDGHVPGDIIVITPPETV